MNWIALKVTNLKRFKKLDAAWRKEHKDYLRAYNTKYRRKYRARKNDVERTSYRAS